MSYRPSVIGVAVLAAAMICSCSDRDSDGVLITPARVRAADAPEDDVAKLAIATNLFAAEVYGKLMVKPGNFAYSPYSLHAALTLNSGGARGRTLEEMRAALYHSLPAEQVHSASASLLDSLVGDTSAGTSPLRIANALWLEKTYPLKQPFVDLARDHYLAPVSLVDFKGDAAGAVKTINQWTSKQTGGKIPASLDAQSLNSGTRLVISNAAYFKGEWKAVFSEKATWDATFHLTPTTAGAEPERIMVPTMHNSDQFGYLLSRDMRMLKMPFKDGGFSMVVVLPHPSQTLEDLTAAVGITSINDLAGNMQTRSVEIALPKFTFRHAVRMRPLLKSLGMNEAFDATRADFLDIADPVDEEAPFIDDVFHEAAIVVDEKGAKAAAVTHGHMKMKDGPAEREEKPRFIADRPFIFLIRHEATGVILFMGRVSDPRG